MAEKTVNYTPEMTATMVERYNEGKGEPVEVIAESMGRSVRSVIAKLSREGVYKAKSAEKAGKRVTKANLVAKLEATLEAPEGSFETLEKASHEALEKLVELVG